MVILVCDKALGLKSWTYGKWEAYSTYGHASNTRLLKSGFIPWLMYDQFNSIQDLILERKDISEM